MRMLVLLGMLLAMPAFGWDYGNCPACPACVTAEQAQTICDATAHAVASTVVNEAPCPGCPVCPGITLGPDEFVVSACKHVRHNRRGQLIGNCVLIP